MTRFRDDLINDPKIDLDICDCYTSATLAKKLFFKKYYNNATYNSFVQQGNYRK